VIAVPVVIVVAGLVGWWAIGHAPMLRGVSSFRDGVVLASGP
jgi:hypothetical protein